ncbi:P-loop containing nucleoside triphosphate hydrolase protein [Teratosphaeria nubilosa]|uniref:RNA helicase n=1 Tax=Teratosphaeria nubilosa TaxID=161662 RepID=A0A6G1LJN3_9PEZI|nr:P-loop containing nucleoside triphosphate hydrolase protein [Teratosphaeria nubilosa]
MVNKPHAPRHGNKKKQGTAAAANGEDTSWIVFGDDKPGKKGKQPQQDAPAVASGSKAAPPEGEKKPDTRTLIAGSSWTGKLPLTLFNEHCQKQKWEKCEYTTHRRDGGWTGAVIIKQKNPKTGEITSLPPILPPKSYFDSGKGIQESAVEARHFAAAYALFRVGNMKNLSMALPPQYRDLWKGDFQDLRKDAVEIGQGYLYEADPFLAAKHREEDKAKKEKERVEKTKKREEDQKQKTVVTLDGSTQRLDKPWQKAPKVEMGVKTRREVEALVRREGVWNAHDVRIGEKEKQASVARLSSYGFRPSHVEEAAEICKDEEECLEFLLIHLPEDDVPSWALPENYLAGVALAASDLQREGKINRLASTGYSRDLCSDMLDACGGDEGKAAFALQKKLIGDEDSSPQDSGSSEIWEEEQATLEAIYEERHSSSNGICSIRLELRTAAKESITLRARPAPSYPNALPAIGIEANLPAYVKLSILRQCLLHAKENLIGEMMLFSLLDWLEQEIPAIIERPDKLRDLAGATSTTDSRTAPEPVTKRQKQRRHPNPITWTPNTPASTRIKSCWEARQATPGQQRMMEARQKLPAWQLRVPIVASVMANQVTIISGETGSGKSTQSVQFVLDDLIKQGYGEQANIICTQPRRISALGLADRVADERCIRVGDEVGYTIRGESKAKAGVTKITFVTTGVLLRRLQTSGGSTEDVVKSLADVSHVIIDEVHERSLDTDFLLVLLRDVLKRRKDLKLILMSATLDAAVFEGYFSGVSSVGKVEIAGRTYPVQDVYIDEITRTTGYDHLEEEGESDVDEDVAGGFSVGGARKPKPQFRPRKPPVAAGHDGHFIDYDLIAQTVRHIDRELGDTEGGILVFLPGTMEIDRTLRAVQSIPNVHALPLHAGLQSSEQKRVFARPPKGMRKVAAATNVAETSITIEDIVAVIDTGRVKETSFDPANNMVRLMEQWASKAACKQRRGRAGRVRAGKCYKLYTQKQEEKMADRPEPEIRRVPLEQLCLSVKAMGVGDVPAFLASALTPPESLSVIGALTLLARIGALDKNELTALGRHLSMIPADLRCGKLMVYGAAFGCLDACLTIAATLTVKSPFVSPQAKREEAKAAKAAFGRGNGDLLCDLRAFEEWSRRRAKGEPTGSLRRWCDENFLSHQTLLDISTTRTQYISSLQEIGFLRPGHASTAVTESLNRHDASDALLRALIAGSFQPQIAEIKFPEKKYFASATGTVAQDPEAHTIKYFNEENGRVFVHPGSTMFDAQTFPGNAVFMSYFSKMATSKVFVREVTPFNVYGALMFAGIGVLVSRLRGCLDEVLARKVDEPGLEMEGLGVVGVVRRVVEFDGLDR